MAWAASHVGRYTGSESAIAEALLAHLGLRRYFDAVGGESRTASQTCATRRYCAPSGVGVMPTPVRGDEDADFGFTQAARAAGMDAVDVRLLW